MNIKHIIRIKKRKTHLEEYQWQNGGVQKSCQETQKNFSSGVEWVELFMNFFLVKITLISEVMLVQSIKIEFNKENLTKIKAAA